MPSSSFSSLFLYPEQVVEVPVKSRIADGLNYQTTDGKSIPANRDIDTDHLQTIKNLSSSLEAPLVSTAELMQAIYHLDKNKVANILANQDLTDLSLSDTKKLEFFRLRLKLDGKVEALKLFDQTEHSILNNQKTAQEKRKIYLRQIQQSEGIVKAITQFFKKSLDNEYYQANALELQTQPCDSDDTHTALFRYLVQRVAEKLLREKNINSAEAFEEAFKKIFDLKNFSPIAQAIVKDILIKVQSDKAELHKELTDAVGVFTKYGESPALDRIDQSIYEKAIATKRKVNSINLHGLKTLAAEAARERDSLNRVENSIPKLINP